MMKIKLLILLFLIVLSKTIAQEVNPFESIGKEGKILTLSNGKYKEVHVNDSLQRIGSVIMNMNTGEIYKLLDVDTLYSESNLDPTVISRWYSLDPLMSTFPGMSPYVAFDNNPIYYTDPYGLSAVNGDPPPGTGKGEEDFGQSTQTTPDGGEIIIPMEADNLEFFETNSTKLRDADGNSFGAPVVKGSLKSFDYMGEQYYPIFNQQGTFGGYRSNSNSEHEITFTHNHLPRNEVNEERKVAGPQEAEVKEANAAPLVAFAVSTFTTVILCEIYHYAKDISNIFQIKRADAVEADVLSNTADNQNGNDQTQAASAPPPLDPDNEDWINKDIEGTTVREGRDGKAIEIRFKDGTKMDITKARVKQWSPNSHPNSPKGVLQKIKFNNSLAGSKGYKRLPTAKELEFLNNH